MPEPLARGLLVAGVTVVALAVAWLAPRWSAGRRRRSPLDLSDVEGRVVLVSAASCRRCDAIREVLHDADARFTEIRYEDDPVRFEATGAREVPILVGRDDRGAEVMRLVGAASARRIRALLEACSAGRE